MVSRDVPVGKTAGPPRTLSARPAPLEFNMVGLHWRGSGTVWFRTAGAAGTWSDWQPAAPEEEDGPDRGSPEGAAAAGWKLGNPYWTGAADRIEYRLSGTVTHLRAHFVSSDVRGCSDALWPRRGRADDHRSQAVGRERVDRARAAGVRAERALRERSPHGRDELLHGRAVGGDRPRDPALPRASRTAGTTSATTSSSPSTARSSKAVPGGSIRLSSARTPEASTPGARASPSSARTAACPCPLRAAQLSNASSPGAWTSLTSTRLQE